MGFEIEIANNGAEGFYKFRKHRIDYFDLILTDLRMPNMSGQSMILKIKELEGEYIYKSYIHIYIYYSFLRSKPNIPIIVLAGDPSENERKRCLNILKVNSFLNKPVSIHQFTVQLRKIFDTSENEEEVKYPDSQRRNYILIVEDDTLLNNLVKHFLSDFEVLQAYSVKEVSQNVYFNNIYRGQRNSKIIMGKYLQFALTEIFKMGLGLISLKYPENLKVYKFVDIL